MSDYIAVTADGRYGLKAPPPGYSADSYSLHRIVDVGPVGPFDYDIQRAIGAAGDFFVAWVRDPDRIEVAATIADASMADLLADIAIEAAR